MVGTSPLKKKSLQLGEALGGSVQETLAGLLPAAGRAPQVPVVHAVHFPALLSITPGLPEGTHRYMGCYQGWAPPCLAPSLAPLHTRTLGWHWVWLAGLAHRP